LTSHGDELHGAGHAGESGDRTWRDVIEPIQPIEPDDEPTTIRPPLALVEPAAATPIPALIPAAPIPAAAPPPEPEPPAPTPPEPTSAAVREPSATRLGKIGKYDLRDKLGRGAFGVVYLARDPSLERDIAIKVLRLRHRTNGDIVQRFLQEARATARIAHPGIVTIYDCGLVEASRGPTAFIAMELLAGESLTKRLARSGRIAPALAIEIVRQVASALEAAHRVDVLHRDLKPDNIYLVPDPAMPSGERVKILDFGLAKLGHDGHTQVQNVFGTPRYMSPEQCRSSAQVDHRGDIYSLGCILFELVTGEPPFEGNVRQVIDRHRRMSPPRARSIAPECPAALDDLIAGMLAKDPLARPQTMAAVQRELLLLGTSAAPVAPTGDTPASEVRSEGPAENLSTERSQETRPEASVVAEPAPAASPAPREGAMSGEILVDPISPSAEAAAPRPALRASSGHPTPPARAHVLSGADRRLHQLLARYTRHSGPVPRIRYARLVTLGVATIGVAVAAAFLLA
jgi:serine/threonine protein kinase